MHKMYNENDKKVSNVIHRVSVKSAKTDKRKREKHIKQEICKHSAVLLNYQSIRMRMKIYLLSAVARKRN